MLPSHDPDPNARLLQLLAELQAYESHIRRLVRESQQRHDVVLFGEPSKAMDRMRTLAAPISVLLLGTGAAGSLRSSHEATPVLGLWCRAPTDVSSSP